MMIRLVAPIRKRHVIVDSHEIDLVIGPQRIEVQIPVAGTVLRLETEIFRPIGGIADLGLWQQGPDFRCEGTQRRYCGKRARAPPDRGQATQFGPDAKRFDPTSGRAEGGIVQNEPSQAPVVGIASIGHNPIANHEFGGHCRPEECGDLGFCCGRTVR